MTYTWKQLFLVGISALIVIVCADLALSSIAPPVKMREVEDGIRDFSAQNPDTLVLGSSHARTLHVLGQELQQRTQGHQTLVAVPLENGKLVPYRWVLEHRLAPLIDRQDASGAREKSRLKRFVLITEWWDSCPREDGSPYWNLPARAWTFEDFLDAVASEGITGFNRNYLQNRLRRLFASSALVYDRTQQAIVFRLTDLASGRPLGLTPEMTQVKLAGWQRLVERGVGCIGSDVQMQALKDIANFAQARNLEMTILLFPRKPGTLSDLAKRTTLPQFAALVRQFAEPRGIRVIDMTTAEPILDEDFMDDFDHINANGNQKFASWALDHDLGFLQQSPQAMAGGGMGTTAVRSNGQ